MMIARALAIGVWVRVALGANETETQDKVFSRSTFYSWISECHECARAGETWTQAEVFKCASEVEEGCEFEAAYTEWMTGGYCIGYFAPTEANVIFAIFYISFCFHTLSLDPSFVASAAGSYCASTISGSASVSGDAIEEDVPMQLHVAGIYLAHRETIKYPTFVVNISSLPEEWETHICEDAHDDINFWKVSRYCSVVPSELNPATDAPLLFCYIPEIGYIDKELTNRWVSVHLLTSIAEFGGIGVRYRYRGYPTETTTPSPFRQWPDNFSAFTYPTKAA